MDSLPMDALPDNYPRSVLAVDYDLQVVHFSLRALAVFGIRTRGERQQWRQALQEALIADTELDDRLALATARLGRPGDEETFAWQHRERSYEVELVAAEGELLWVTFSDSTHKVRSEEILSEARHYLEHILNNIPSGVVVLGRNLCITAVNRP